MNSSFPDLDLPGPPASNRVVVAMSGGVDSTVAAALLAEAGYDVVGVTLQLYDHGAAVPTGKTCCAGQDIQDARNAADLIGIPHYVLDYENRFRQSVMDDFADSYLRGETPIPCVRCNQTVKFSDLLQTARDLGAAALATGHYVRRRRSGDDIAMLRGADPAKDQSYFLFATTPAQLAYLRFPVGHMSKTETRDHARRLGLNVAEKPDSQDICFVPNGRYQDIVAKLRPGAIEPGDIVDLAGRRLGGHDGIIGFTVGQRRGLDIGGAAEPYYVVRLEPVTRRVIVGPRAALAQPAAWVQEVNWLGDSAGFGGVDALVKLRSAAGPTPATLHDQGAGRARAQFAEPQFGVAPGQACVFYDSTDPDRLLGGGWITAAPMAADVAAPDSLTLADAPAI